MATDSERRIHRNWIVPLQPVGLVVSIPALLAAQAFPDNNILKERQILLELISPPAPKDGERTIGKRDFLPLSFTDLATRILGWKANKFAGGPDGPTLPETLNVVLPEFGETLRPTFAVPAIQDGPSAHGGATVQGNAASPDGSNPKQTGDEWMALIQELPEGTPLDEPLTQDTKKWQASPQVRLERLLRETGVPIGILANGRLIRLVYAPRGESSGHITWPVTELARVSDYQALPSLCMVLGRARLFSLPREQRLPHILKESRKYQNVVSTKLAGQVLEALNTLLRGFQSANAAVQGRLLDDTVRADPDHVYGGLLAVLLRLVFILYAEERGLLSSSAVYVRNYALTGLFAKLRADAGRFPDTMDTRYGAWSQLLVLFRMVHDGALCRSAWGGELHLPPRYGHLFDPDGWAFLEGRPHLIPRVMGAPVDVPKVSDGTVYRVLEKLLLLDGDQLSYRALDVEQIGSVYENMMGFRLERASETCLGVGKAHVVIGLETLLEKKGGERGTYLKDLADVELSGKAADALKQATSIEALVAALNRRISPLTPHPVQAGGLYLQPTDERRRSGSHYTPRELTEPIVRTTLRPILEDLGSTPTPAQILALKVCDPAMGSGAFLVEACRQLGEQLVKAYDVHGRPSDVPPDEDILLYAQRLIAQHCLYGVDKNPFAVDLGKLSLWLATLARAHAFTFLDHSIRHGDSLVGLSREQLASFHWAPSRQLPFVRTLVDKAIGEALALRQRIHTLANSDDVREKRRLLREADDALAKVRKVGDCVVASFFSEEKPKAREEALKQWETKVQSWLAKGHFAGEISEFVDTLRTGEKPVPCFHWEIEFPEVFSRENGGFDCVVGNPPFMGGSIVSMSLSKAYTFFLTENFAESRGKSDLVAYFFRRAYVLIRSGGTSGLVATNTIRQGDTRYTGLRWIRENGGSIFAAVRRLRWTGSAAVLVSVVHFIRSIFASSSVLDGNRVPTITAYLQPFGPDDDPARLASNKNVAHSGVNPNGKGFILTSEERLSLIKQDSSNAVIIFPFLGSSDMNDSPTAGTSRFIIRFDECDEEVVRAYPAVYRRLYDTVRLQRAKSKETRLRERWWNFSRPANELTNALTQAEHVLVSGRLATHHTLTYQPSSTVFSDAVTVFLLKEKGAFAILQCQPHELWAEFQGSSFKDDPRYIPEGCFETFPFPPHWQTDSNLETAGQIYYDFRAALMIRNNEGLTKTYNRFHDPEETDPDIHRLRDLHDAMDRAVLDAYGWTDIQPTCEFLLDYEDEEDDNESTENRRKKKPWRYRWPDDVRDEVLARLLELNALRAKEEAAAASDPKADAQERTKKPAAKRGTKPGNPDQESLF